MASVKSFQDSDLFKTFTKCGHIYKSPAINDKHYLLLSCLECSDVFWELETFLEHTHKHVAEDDLFPETIEDDPEGNVPVKEETKKSKEYENDDRKEKDPLEEDGCDFLDIPPPDIIKMENMDIVEKVEMEIQMEFPKDGDSTYNDIDTDDDDVSDYDFEPDKQSDEDEHCIDYDDHEDDDDVGDDNEDVFLDNTHDNIKNFPEDEKTNLKRFTKNHSFIRTIIEAYKQHDLLWDTTSKSRNPQKKLEAYSAILKVVNDKYHINPTTKQLEMVIKRLRLRFIQQYRRNRFCSLRSDDNTKSLWYYDLLKFIEPHISGIQQKTSLCQELSDGQFQTLIKLFKDNECFWNENNIYHTSVVYKEESLQAMTNRFNASCDPECFTVNDMKNVIEELKDMAMEENKHMLKECKSLSNEYQPLNKFHSELKFLLPHVGPFNCKHCSKSFLDVYSYKFHVSKHDGTKPFKCMLCQKELTHKKEFMCHLRRHTKECPFQCEMCDKAFPSKKEWQRHVIKHGSKPYVCELCADSFYTQHQLTNHMKNHANIRDHVCPQCGKGFTHRGLLRQHLQTHNKTECLCPICNNIYANPRSLRKHYVRVHELQKETSSHMYNCKICLITFPTIQEAKQHRKEHKQSLPTKRKHVCDICGHDFAYPRNLADHKKIHTNIRDQVCDVCGKAFTNTNLLNQHKNVHNGQKFICKACGKDYAHYRGLCRHIAKVHGTNIKELCSVIEKQSQEISSQ